MSVKFLLALQIFCLAAVSNTYATGVEIGFTVDNDVSQAMINDFYDVDENFCINQETFGDALSASILDYRELSGSGDLTAIQSYAGSAGCSGLNYLQTFDAKVALKSSAFISAGKVSADEQGILDGKNGMVHLQAASAGSREEEKITGDDIDFKGTLSSGAGQSDATIDTVDGSQISRQKTFTRNNGNGFAVLNIDTQGSTLSVEELPVDVGELFNMHVKSEGPFISLNIGAKSKLGAYEFLNIWSESGTLEAYPSATITETGVIVKV